MLTRVDYVKWEHIGDEQGHGLSNLDHTIDDGIEDQLKSGQCWTQYAGINFNGRVWWDGEQFVCDVWVYGVSCELLAAPTLKELMTVVSNKYGWD